MNASTNQPIELNLALRSIYSTASPNAAIELYNGSLEVEQEENRIATSGTVKVEWLRYPDIKLHITESNSAAAGSLVRLDMDKPVLLHLTECATGVDINILQYNDNSGQQGLSVRVLAGVAPNIRYAGASQTEIVPWSAS